jgi:outer membrane protein OmpA-like peptidoglycan-associated protein
MLFAANDAKAQEAVVVEEGLALTASDATPHYYNTWRDGWFLQFGAGMNVPFFEHNAVDGRKDHHITATYNLGFGKWFSPYFGWRISGLYAPQHWELNGMNCFKAASLNLDIMWDAFNSIGGVNPNRVFSMVPFIGLGGAFGWDFDGAEYSNISGSHGIKRNQWALPVSAGLQLRFRLCKYVDFFAEGRLQLVPDNFNNCAYNRPIEGIITAIGGFNINFGGRSFKKCDPTPYLNYINTLNGQVNDLRNELANCGNRLAAAEAQLPCPQVVAKDCPEATTTPLFSTVRFTINSARVSDSEMVNVYNIAEYMKANPDSKIVIKGYADKKTGTSAYNMNLSKRRAEAVQNILVNKYGIDKDRLSIDAAGSDVQPYSTNNWNRIVIFSQD